jgi:deazaflavin-dependent oxidoreductase (nitroreductase family)
MVVGMRRKSPAVVDAVRRINRRLLNPRQMRTAGARDAFAAVIHHTGRTSGREYQTPIGAVPADDGFLVPLPYGTRADWVKNVLAAGRADIVHAGRTHVVERPEVIPTNQVISEFGPSDRRALRMFAVDRCLRVRTTSVAADRH